MRHSIIIPHRNRQTNVRECIDSILAAERPAYDLEILVVDNDSPVAPLLHWPARLIQDTADMPAFNKSRLLNIGLDAATGDVLTILDADAIVAPRWEQFAVAHALNYSKVCHRVWKIPECWPRGDCAWQAAFAQVDRLSLAFEAYGRPDLNRQPADGNGCSLYAGNVHGNSQFTARRELIGGMRFDERFVGRGFEDLEFNWRFWARHGQQYNAVLSRDPQHGLLHRETANTWGGARQRPQQYLAAAAAAIRDLRAAGSEVAK